MIIQFSHNGPELNISRRSIKYGVAYKFDNPSLNTGLRYWNNEPLHKRKFMKHRGWYLENKGHSFDFQPKSADLYFWGEWEPQSRFELTGNRYSTTPSLPHAVHFPIFSNQNKGRHNTDPFVFGKHFYYTNCKQSLSGKGKKMVSLPSQTIILFGSEKNRKDFVIDTVFVVHSSETVANYKLHPSKYPKTLREATIDLHGGLANWNMLYKGKMYDFNNLYTKQNPYTFCFFPCKIDCRKTGFERPVINWRKFNLQKPGAGTVLREVQYSSEINFWDDLVNELLKQGFSLGIKLEMPR